MSESLFFKDLAMLMAVAGLVAAVFTRLAWPKVIGYILAGIALSEHTWGNAILADTQSVMTIGQLGVVLLMFSLGLDFSTRDMARLKSVTFPVAIIDTVIMTWLGYMVGTRVLNWGNVPSLFLGAAICDSATTMLVKVIDEMKWSAKPFVKYAIGSSVCEDIITVGIIALITGVAAGDGISLGAAGVSLGGLLVFFLAVIVFGLVLIPRLLVSISKRKDEETLLLTILGTLFFVSYIAYRFNFSLALGAFLVGIIGASSDVRLRLTEMAAPLKAMFASVFFVSIGLLVDPMACWHHLPIILFLTVTVVVGKFINVTVGALITGEPFKTAVRMGMSLAQIGEFAYMVALLYISRTGDVASPMYQIVVAVSLLTTLLNPFMIRWSVPFSEKLEAMLPHKLRTALDTYADYAGCLRSKGNSNPESATIRSDLLKISVLAILIFAVATACRMLYRFDYSRFSPYFEAHDRLFFFMVSNVFALMLLPSIIKLARSMGASIGVGLVGTSEMKWQQKTRNLIEYVVAGVVLFGFFIEGSMLNISLAPRDDVSIWITSLMMLIIAILGWKQFRKAGIRAAIRFNEALGAEERREKLTKMMTVSVPEGTLHQLKLEIGSPAIGGTVVTLNIRAKTGASVVSIIRGDKTLRNIGPETEFRVDDTLVVLGDGGQVAALKDLLGIIA